MIENRHEMIENRVEMFQNRGQSTPIRDRSTTPDLAPALQKGLRRLGESGGILPILGKSVFERGPRRYYIGLDLLRGFKTWWKDIPQSDWKKREDDFRDGMHRARVAARDALVPTFVVILPGDHDMRRGPGLLTVPQLWPDSNDPEAITAEVLATCRAIEEV